MKGARRAVLALCVMAGALAGCNEETTRDVQYYLDHADERAAKLAECKNNPGESMLGNPMTIRLSPEKQALYEEEAARRGRPLSTYLRERLESEDGGRAELAELRQDLADLRRAIDDMPNQAAANSGESASGKGLLLEILLMLRAIGGPDRTKVVRSELSRLGYAIWTLEEAHRG